MDVGSSPDVHAGILGDAQPSTSGAAKGLDAERFYCPYPGCNRSFAELWRLKVHYRAPPDIRGSGKERGHGTELTHCPKCGKTLKPGKHHVGCSGGKTAPRQATRRKPSDADGPDFDDALDGPPATKVKQQPQLQQQQQPQLSEPPAYPWPDFSSGRDAYAGLHASGSSQMPSLPINVSGAAAAASGQDMQDVKPQLKPAQQAHQPSELVYPHSQPTMVYWPDAQANSMMRPATVAGTTQYVQYQAVTPAGYPQGAYAYAYPGYIQVAPVMGDQSQPQAMQMMPMTHMQQAMPMIMAPGVTGQPMQIVWPMAQQMAQPSSQPVSGATQPMAQTQAPMAMAGQPAQMALSTHGQAPAAAQQPPQQPTQQQPQHMNHMQMHTQMQAAVHAHPQQVPAPQAQAQPHAQPAQQHQQQQHAPAMQGVPQAHSALPQPMPTPMQQHSTMMPGQLGQQQLHPMLQQSQGATQQLSPTTQSAPAGGMMSGMAMAASSSVVSGGRTSHPGSSSAVAPAGTATTTTMLSGATSAIDVHANALPDDMDEFVNGLSRIPSPPPLPPDFHPAGASSGVVLFNFSQFNQRLPRVPSMPKLDADLGLDTPDADLFCDQTDDGDLMQLLFGIPDDLPTMATIHLHKWNTDRDDTGSGSITPVRRGSTPVRHTPQLQRPQPPPLEPLQQQQQQQQLAASAGQVQQPAHQGGVGVARPVPPQGLDGNVLGPGRPPMAVGGHGPDGSGTASMAAYGSQFRVKDDLLMPPPPPPGLGHGQLKAPIPDALSATPGLLAKDAHSLVQGSVANGLHVSEHHKEVDHLFDAETQRLLTCD